MISSQFIFTTLQIAILTVCYYCAITTMNITEQQREITFIRHGARSPNKYTELDSQLWENFKPGYLTEKGFRQLIKVGQSYKNQGITDKNQKCDYSQLNIVSSIKPRVIHSTIGFITGLCPGNYQEILTQYFQEYFQKYSTDELAFKQILQDNFTNPLSFALDTFNMNQDFLFHGHSSDVCPVLADIKAEIMGDSKYLIANEQFKNKFEFQEVFKQMKISTPSLEKSDVTINKMKTFYGGYKCNNANNFNAPVLSKQAQNYLDEVFIYKFYNMDNSDQRQHLSALTRIFEWTIQQLNSDYQFSFYIGHDSNQVAMLSVLVDEPLIPPFASKLSFVLNGDYVNLTFQNQILETKICNSKINCTKSQVIRYLRQFIANNLEKLCNPQ